MSDLADILNGLTRTAKTVALVFIILKLTGDINWPWHWVLAPVWIAGLILIIVFLSIVFTEGTRGRTR